MKSPITGGEARLCEEPRELTYRNGTYSYVYRYYVCKDTGVKFTDTALDTENMEQVYQQYRQRYGIPSPQEILATRKRYGLSAAKMSEILGLGANQYRLYESGEMPSQAIGKMLRSIETPAVFLGYIENARQQMPQSEYDKISNKVKQSFVNLLKKIDTVSHIPATFFAPQMA